MCRREDCKECSGKSSTNYGFQRDDARQRSNGQPTFVKAFEVGAFHGPGSSENSHPTCDTRPCGAGTQLNWISTCGHRLTSIDILKHSFCL